MRDIKTIRAALRDIHEGSPTRDEINMTALAKAIGVDRSSLHNFIYGRPPEGVPRLKAEKEGTLKYGSADVGNLRRMDNYLTEAERVAKYKARPKYKPKPPTKWEIELAKIKRDEAATRIVLEGLTDDPKPSGIRCGDSFFYDPRFGLTEADYEAFAPHISDPDMLQALREAVDLAQHFRSRNLA